MTNTPVRNIRIDDATWQAAKAKAAEEGLTASAAIKRLVTLWLHGSTAVVAVLAVLLLGACGSQEPATSPVAERSAPAGTSAPETTSEAVSEPAETVQAQPVGADQNLYVGGEVVARVAFLTHDPVDFTATVQINNVGPVVINPADFTLTTTDGAEIVGVAALDGWDLTLAANDQTTGPVAFPGATAPTTLTYFPDGADEPLVWSFI